MAAGQRRTRKRKSPKPKLRDPRVVEKFWSLVEEDEDRLIPSAPWLGPCWLWTGRTNAAGYGELSVGRATWRAHRYSWKLHYGEPAWPTIDHLCHSYSHSCLGGDRCKHRLCVNPDHLEPVSRSENSRRVGVTNHYGEPRRPVVFPVCPNGHRWGWHLAMYDAAGRRICGDCAEGMY